MIQLQEKPTPNNPWTLKKYNTTHPIVLNNTIYFIGRTPVTNCFVSFANNPGLRSKILFEKYLKGNFLFMGNQTTEHDIACYLMKYAKVTGAAMQQGFVTHIGTNTSLLQHHW